MSGHGNDLQVGEFPLQLRIIPAGVFPLNGLSNILFLFSHLFKFKTSRNLSGCGNYCAKFLPEEWW
jgi:hypothetical protein